MHQTSNRMNTILALSETDFERLQKLEGELKVIERKVEALISERDRYKAAYEKGVELALNKSVEYENMRKLLAKSFVMLGQACDEMEGIFQSTDELASPAIATDYTVWARFLEKHHGRTGHLADKAQEWIDNQ